MYYRAVGRSENLGEGASSNLPPVVEIGLTDLLKSALIAWDEL